MITPNREDVIHKAWLYRVLTGIVDNPNLNELYFKGGTCAAMLGYLDRFSVDLDFDYIGDTSESKVSNIRQELHHTFDKLDLEIKDESKTALQFFLKYPIQDPNKRNTLKVDISFPPPKANIYEARNFVDIDRVINCQDIKTMFANKLVAILDRYEKHNLIAGRDVYDIHHFFMNGYEYNSEVIKERTGLSVKDFFISLDKFISEKITDTIINQDLNVLLPYDKFSKIRKVLKSEVLMCITQIKTGIAN